MASAPVRVFTTDNWEREVLQSDQPVLVDFWGPGCGPCDMLAPILEKVAQQFAGRAKVGQVNVYEQFELANEYSVHSIPRVFLFHRHRKPLRQVVGLTTEAELTRMLDEALRK